MYTGRTLFSQVMDFVPWTSFNRIVAKYRGDRDTRTLRCTEHFRVMAFAQVTYRESLRDIEACLGAQPAKLCSMGLRGRVGPGNFTPSPSQIPDLILSHHPARAIARRLPPSAEISGSSRGITQLAQAQRR